MAHQRGKERTRKVALPTPPSKLAKLDFS